MVYARKLKDGKVLEFGVSGALYRDALVFYDRETASYWSQVDGEALRGPMKGTKLTEVPSTVMKWVDWKRIHPKTLVLRSDFGPRQSPYADYYANSEKLGVRGTKNPDDRLPGKTWVWGFVDEGKAVAVVEERLGTKPVKLEVGNQRLRVGREGDHVSFVPEGVVFPRRMYWFVWARFHPGSRIWPEKP